jgi:hypothetical protein
MMTPPEFPPEFDIPDKPQSNIKFKPLNEQAGIIQNNQINSDTPMLAEDYINSPKALPPY